MYIYIYICIYSVPRGDLNESKRMKTFQSYL